MAKAGRDTSSAPQGKTYDVVIVGGGSAGIATAASLLKRRASLAIAIVEPAEMHYYQPGWTLVGGGVFKPEVTGRPMASVMPDRVTWVRQAASGFSPESNEVILTDGSALRYRVLVAAPGLKLNWDAIPGLTAALGKNGVTSNYRYDLAPYTHELASSLRRGRALFTQPPMPIKCAGAPQKAMYLSCDIMRQAGTLKNVEVEFHNAGAVLFGVPAYVPALMKYVEKYGIDLRFGSKLVAVDGAAKIATFERKSADGKPFRRSANSTCCTPYRRRCRWISWRRVRSPGKAALSPSIPARCNIRSIRTCTAWGMPARRPTPRRRPRRASRPRWWR